MLIILIIHLKVISLLYQITIKLSSKMETVKRISNGQVKEIANQISKRWKFDNHNSYFNCIDVETGQRSNDGGDYNFASKRFNDRVESLYLNMIGENSLYFQWSEVGVTESNERKTYLMKIQYKVVFLLCGYKSKSPALSEIYN